MKTPVKICHLTTVHVRYDTRIFVKECCGLAKNGYDVTLIVADGQGDEEKNGVKIVDIGKPSGRIKRILTYHKKILKRALEVDAEVYHFHDPELLRSGSRLIKLGKTVVYDSHEDVPRQVLDKAYIPALFRKPLSRLIERFEDRIVAKLAGVVTVTPNLENRFFKNNRNVVQVRNFPHLQEFETNASQNITKENAVCYVGAITKVRGILGMVDAMQYQNDTKLLLGGKFENEALRNQTTSSKGWSNVQELGFLNREEVRNTLLKSKAGLVLLEPTQSYLDSIPVKMFEYMVAGIPVIASDFKYWRELIEEENCALFVDPKDPKAISNAISLLIEDKRKAEQMGQNGRKAVLEKFNWSKEEKKLMAFYERVRV
ncbi:glycosyltransferase family 4 protein [Maribacter sp. 2308TA10-17]|uniref:glycosyltransferase family 4 protein n=1 Tax=Maribacter sp. 2308TA10-17 TaxID=3386276 RepID=UPI0039BCFD5E